MIEQLLHAPAFWLAATLGIYLGATRLFLASRRFALLNPVLLTVTLLAILLWLTGTPYARYESGAHLVGFLLGPATVALAIPLYQSRDLLRRTWLPLAGGLVAGSLVTVLSVVAIGHWLGLSRPVLLALAPKAVTTPIALGITAKLGGATSLVAVFTVVTGVTGATIGLAMLRLIRVHDDETAGFAMGLSGSGIGTARAFEESERMGAFGGLAVGLNGLFTAVVLPLLMHWHLLPLR
ncbi:MAG TPA: LrgB family protein [Gammaproteobacteria bacterium]|nr:LrgB family protein [Gammaproteobacteria bacterium]